MEDEQSQSPAASEQPQSPPVGPGVVDQVPSNTSAPLEPEASDNHAQVPTDILDEELAQTLSQLNTLDVRKRRETLLNLRQIVSGQANLHSTMRDSVQPTNSGPMVIVDKLIPKLRKFSGKIPIPNGEVSFDTYRDCLQTHLEDPECNERKIRHAILESLSEPAISAVQTIRGKSPEDILSLLTSLFGSVEDTEELMINFTGHTQKSSEKASDYLKDLYLELTHIASLRRMGVREFDQLLCKQFVRGCNDETLLLKLRLEDEMPNSINLITMVRSEEARRLERRLRLRERDKGAKVNLAVSTETSQGAEVMERLTKVEEQLSYRQAPTMLSSFPHAVPSFYQPAYSFSNVPGSADNALQAPAQRRPNEFCYRCGIEGHFAVTCANAPNEERVNRMVQERRKQRAGRSVSKHLGNYKK